jgi:hypothetical protein|nr:MAG TPA: hypothetical protein [Caudoviricetes sp.]
MLKQSKLIIYHGKEFLVPERFFIDYKESIVFTTGHCEVFVKSQPQFEYEEGETYAIGLLPNLQIETRLNLQGMTRRLNALPVKDQDDDDFSYFVTREFGKAPVKEDDELMLKIHDDVIAFPQDVIGRFNFITFDEDYTIRLHETKPFYKSGRWDSTNIQLRWGKLENLLTDVSLLASTYHNINWLVDQAKSINIELKQPIWFIEHNVIQFYKNGKKVKSGTKTDSKVEETVANEIMAKFDDLIASAGKLFEEASKFFRPSK